MRCRLALIFAFTALACLPALAKPVPVERRMTHPDGASILVKSIEFKPDSIVLVATISNPGERAIHINRGRSLVLDDGAHDVYRLNAPPENPELTVPPHAEISGDLVFIGPLAPTTRQLTLSSNVGVGTRDNPFDDAPIFTVTLPVEDQPARTAGSVATHPDGAALRVRSTVVGPRVCHVTLVATNGNDRTIVLNQDNGLVLTDDRGAAAPVEPPAENRELVVPPGARLDADLAFDCSRIDAGATLTLVTNRGTAGTPDNPYDTLPVITLKVPVEKAADSPGPPVSRASVTPIARSQLSAPEAVAAAAPAPTPAPAPAVTPPPPATPTAPTTPSRALPQPAPAQRRSPKTLAQLEAALHAEKTDRGFRLVVPADSLFGSKQSALDASAEPLMADLTELIAAMRLREVVINSHTDSVGSDATNLALSKERAHVIAAWLSAHVQQDRPQFVEEGFGRTRPVAPNHKSDGSDNPEGRAQNRRIEILLRRH